MTDYKRLVDVSHYQPPGRVPWSVERLAGGIVKACEGTSIDHGMTYHPQAIRAAGKLLGLYLFFRPKLSPKTAKDTFNAAAASVEYTSGDIIPTFDIERVKMGSTWKEAEPSWNEFAEEVCELLSAEYSNVLIYCSRVTWIELGRPKWLLQYPLFVPQYNFNGCPPPNPDTIKTPGGLDWTLAQTYVGPMFGTIQATNTAQAVDHDWARSIPLIP